MNIDTTINEVPLINTYLRRTKDGVRVDVKVHPDVEAFFRKWSGGGQDDVRANGRTWKNAEAGKRLLAWSFNNQDVIEQLRPISLHALGQPINSRELTNISYIRLCGASEGDGVSFLCDVVMGRNDLDRLGERLKRAQEDFYRELIQPMDVEIQLLAAVRKGAPPLEVEV
jgi:hypothetical protein